MSQLATAFDIETNLGRNLSSAESLRVSALLDRASQLIRAYTGLTFDQQTVSSVLRITAGSIRLPQRPVLSVTAVKLIGYDGVQRYAVPFIWDGLDQIVMTGDLAVLNLPEILHDVYARTAEVDYTFGYATVPETITSLCAEMVTRVFQNPGTPGVVQQNAGPFGYRVADGFGGQVMLTAADKQQLDDSGYRRGIYAVGLL